MFIILDVILHHLYLILKRRSRKYYKLYIKPILNALNSVYLL